MKQKQKSKLAAAVILAALAYGLAATSAVARICGVAERNDVLVHLLFLNETVGQKTSINQVHPSTRNT